MYVPMPGLLHFIWCLPGVIIVWRLETLLNILQQAGKYLQQGTGSPGISQAEL